MTLAFRRVQVVQDCRFLHLAQVFHHFQRHHLDQAGHLSQVFLQLQEPQVGQLVLLVLAVQAHHSVMATFLKVQVALVVLVGRRLHHAPVALLVLAVLAGQLVLLDQAKILNLGEKKIAVSAGTTHLSHITRWTWRSFRSG